jgi:glutathione S-transferase
MPEQTLKIYDMENCPFCRLAREAMEELSLDYELYPSPKQGQRYRPELIARGGKAQFPYLIDANTNTEMYESLDIVRYLYDTYGDGKLPGKWRLGGLQTLRSMLISATRSGRSLWVKASHQPAQLLQLHSGEANPGARAIRELMCQLELPFHSHPQSGQARLSDPNTGTELNGKKAILNYLRNTYAA